jgi:uncharacterized tellurite resistance protein B-like protein
MTISFFKRVFGLDDAEAASYKDLGFLFETLSEKFATLSDEEIKRTTAYAGMLGKVSYADMNISEVEVSRIREILTSVLKLSSRQSDLLIEILITHRIQLFSVEDHFYSRLANELFDLSEKMALLEALFEVAAADGAISQEEDVVLYDAAKSMRLSHREFISVKKRYAAYLDVLKG